MSGDIFCLIPPLIIAKTFPRATVIDTLAVEEIDSLTAKFNTVTVTVYIVPAANVYGRSLYEATLLATELMVTAATAVQPPLRS